MQYPALPFLWLDSENETGGFSGVIGRQLSMLSCVRSLTTLSSEEDNKIYGQCYHPSQQCYIKCALHLLIYGHLNGAESI